MFATLEILVYLYYTSADKAAAEIKPHSSHQSGVSDFATPVDRAGKKGGKKNYLFRMLRRRDDTDK